MLTVGKTKDDEKTKTLALKARGLVLNRPMTQKAKVGSGYERALERD